MSDNELAALAHAGHTEAFDPLYRRYAAEVVRYAARGVRTWGGDQALAEDVAATAWSVALAKIGDFVGASRPEGTFLPWLLTVAKFRGYETMRAMRREHEIVTDAQTLAYMPAADGGAVSGEDDDQRQRQIRERVYQAVATLPPVQRQVARLRLAGHSVTQIAERLGTSMKLASQYWQDARAHLQRQLAEQTGSQHDDPIGRLATLSEIIAAYETVEPEVRLEHRQLRERIDQAVAQLRSPARQTVIRMRLDGRSAQEIAAQTGLSTHQVANAWSKTRPILTRILTSTPADSPISQDKVAA